MAHPAANGRTYWLGVKSGELGSSKWIVARRGIAATSMMGSRDTREKRLWRASYMAKMVTMGNEGMKPRRLLLATISKTTSMKMSGVLMYGERRLRWPFSARWGRKA